MHSQETYRGIVRGSAVELLSATNLPDGTEVDVVVKRWALTMEEKQQQLASLFGSCQADAKDLDRYLELNRQLRQRNRNGQ